MMNENKRTIDQIINDYYPREKCESTWEVFRDLRRDELDLYLWIDEEKEGLNFINDEVDYKDKSRIIDHLLYNLHAATQYDLLDGVDIRLCAEIDVESYVKSIDKDSLDELYSMFIDLIKKLMMIFIQHGCLFSDIAIPKPGDSRIILYWDTLDPIKLSKTSDYPKLLLSFSEFLHSVGLQGLRIFFERENVKISNKSSYERVYISRPFDKEDDPLSKGFLDLRWGVMGYDYATHISDEWGLNQYEELM